MVFNILMANTDDHEQNHSLLCRIRGKTMVLELSPAYDILPTGSGATEHQFFITDTSREPSLEQAMSVCLNFGLSPEQAAAEVVQLIQVVNGWQVFFKGVGITDADIQEMAALIDAPDLLEQRKAFDASRYQAAQKPKKRRSGAAAFR